VATRNLQELLTDISGQEGYFCERDLGPDGLVSINAHGFTGDTPLHVMAWSNDTEGAQVLLDAGANPNAQGEMGETPLHVAVRQCNVALVHALLAAGASTDIRSEFGETPAEMAAATGGDVAGAVARGGT
jgi:uncharacterized protein